MPSEDAEFEAYLKREEGFLGQTPAQFAASGDCIKVHSLVLNDDIYFVANSQAYNSVHTKGLVCYDTQELVHINAVRPDDSAIKSIHYIKKFMDGKVIGHRDLPIDNCQLSAKIEPGKGRQSRF